MRLSLLLLGTALAGCSASGTTLTATINGTEIIGEHALWMKSPDRESGRTLTYVFVTDTPDVCQRFRDGKDLRNTNGLGMILQVKTGGAGNLQGYSAAKDEPATYSAEFTTELPNANVVWAWGIRKDNNCRNALDFNSEGAKSGAVIVDSMSSEDEASGRFAFTFSNGRANGRFDAEWCDASLSDAMTCEGSGGAALGPE